MSVIGAYSATDQATLQHIVEQLGHMKCLCRCTTTPGKLLPCDPLAASHLVGILPHVGHEIFIAWFLALGITSKRASVTAKRAMSHIAALAHHRFSILDEAFLDGFDADAQDLVQNLSQSVSSVFSMPSAFYRKGVLWMSLAVWSKIYATATQDSVEPRLDFLGDGMFIVDMQLCQLVRKTLAGLWRGISPIDHETSLQLTESDISCIHDIMIQSWMHKRKLHSPQGWPRGFSRDGSRRHRGRTP